MNHIAFPPAGHRDGEFTFSPSKAEREDYQIPVDAPSAKEVTFLLASIALTLIGAVSLVASLLSR